MVQQQLRVVILVGAVMGIVLAAAIHIAEQASGHGTAHAVRKDMLQIASSFRNYCGKFAGQSDSSIRNLTFKKIGFVGEALSSNGTITWNKNGVYVISGSGEAEFTLTAHPASQIEGDLSATATASKTMQATLNADRLIWVKGAPR